MEACHFFLPVVLDSSMLAGMTTGPDAWFGFSWWGSGGMCNRRSGAKDPEIQMFYSFQLRDLQENNKQTNKQELKY